jgi:hypothetical protein
VTQFSDVVPQTARSFFDAAGQTLSYLYSRWQDEKEYENIDLYLMPLNKAANEAGVQLTAMTKRPFGVKFVADGTKFHATINGSGRYRLILDC